MPIDAYSAEAWVMSASEPAYVCVSHLAMRHQAAFYYQFIRNPNQQCRREQPADVSAKHDLRMSSAADGAGSGIAADDVFAIWATTNVHRTSPYSRAGFPPFLTLYFPCLTRGGSSEFKLPRAI